MQVKTSLTVKEFRTHFIKNVSPEYASGVHTTADGLWISGQSTNTDFVMQITKPSVASPLAPQARGKITRTEAGCDLKWSVRRPTPTYVALVICVVLSAFVLIPLGFVAFNAIYTALVSNPSLWGMGITFGVLSLLTVTGLVLSLRLLLHVSKRKKERLTRELLRIIGEENLITES